jgi:hypothetical protein
MAREEWGKKRSAKPKKKNTTLSHFLSLRAARLPTPQVRVRVGHHCLFMLTQGRCRRPHPRQRPVARRAQKQNAHTD